MVTTKPQYYKLNTVAVFYTIDQDVTSVCAKNKFLEFNAVTHDKYPYVAVPGRNGTLFRCVL